LRDIFLEEAREVVQNGLAAIDALAPDPGDVSQLTILRRAFHTLKGSSRMVGLAEFGEAAWSLEQVLNTWLADQKPANDDLRRLGAEAMRGFARWIEDIAAGSSGAWKAGMFREPADIFRTEDRLVAMVLPERAAPAQDAPSAVEPASLEDVPPVEWPIVEDVSLEPLAASAGELPTDFDFEIPLQVVAEDAPDSVDLPLKSTASASGIAAAADTVLAPLHDSDEGARPGARAG
jgi:chemosensory pili system protein ChpA (sensor histidine kinase/response regulator)